MSNKFVDKDKKETQEWLDSFDAVVEYEGIEKARYLIEKIAEHAALKGIDVPFYSTTPYANTIPPEKSEKMPGNTLVARNVAAYVRWNAMAMVVKANKKYSGIGGHLSSYSSSAILYEVGFDYFFKGPKAEYGPDMIFFQGHSSPGIYSRAFIEGRLTEEQLKHFRREAKGKGLSSYPHPWLMPDFWQFPTVSMGLGPILAIYQARFMKYMEARGFKDTGDRKVWAFLGDGETDEPESRGAISLASRDKLDNLIFVINCNLQRLDGPVRGNSKIIQELEGIFRGAGWHVIKVIWGSEWDKVLERDIKGILLEKFNSMVDGEFQNLRSKDGAYIRENIFNKDPYLKELVKDFSDKEIWQMSRGGHDPRKIYAAYSEAVKNTGAPTVILAKTIKGFGLGPGESSNIAHNIKKLDLENIKKFRDKFHIPLSDEECKGLPFIRPKKGSEEYDFLHSQRRKLGGYLPQRHSRIEPAEIPGLDSFKVLLDGSKGKESTTTQTFVRMLSTLTRDKNIGKNIVPIVPDEARTFGMEGLFRQLGIYAPFGQLYVPEDSDTFAWYKEGRNGQILEEGITEAGAICSFISAATAYSNYNINMIPFYIFYSMFGFQRVGDLAWLAGDIRARGFLLGATSGRTTLNGEGLQHEDGHSHLLAAAIPNCITYDPTFAYEVVIIIRDGLKTMYAEQKDVYYYITLLNENYEHPPMPEGSEEGIIKGIYLFKENKKADVQLLGSGSILNEAIKAGELLEKDFKILSNIWSIPGINQLVKEGYECKRYNRLNPDKKQKIPYITEILKDKKGPVVISTDYLKSYPEQLRGFIPGPFHVLGTDGFGRSDTREALRDFFEVNRYHIVLTCLYALEKEGKIDKTTVKKAIELYKIDADKKNPLVN